MSQNKKIIIANWKMNPASTKEAISIFSPVKRTAGTLKNVQTIICPPFVHLSELNKKVSGHRCVLGGQDVFYENKGAYTGEVSTKMLTSLGIKYVIVGHSERRALGETNEDVNKKISAAMKNGLTPILCIGEKERDTDAKYLNFIRVQIKEALKNIPKNKISNIIIAYEPVWAIGSSDENADTSEGVFETVLFIRKVLSEIVINSRALDMSILYGGSVNKKNTESLLKEGGVQGLLVGGASLNANIFSAIIKIADKIDECDKGYKKS